MEPECGIVVIIMRFDLERAPSAAFFEKGAQFFDHCIGRAYHEHMIDQKLQIDLQGIDTGVLGKLWALSK